MIGSGYWRSATRPLIVQTLDRAQTGPSNIMSVDHSVFPATFGKSAG